jgi:hypothetical protein
MSDLLGTPGTDGAVRSNPFGSFGCGSAGSARSSVVGAAAGVVVAVVEVRRGGCSRRDAACHTPSNTGSILRSFLVRIALSSFTIARPFAAD